MPAMNQRDILPALRRFRNLDPPPGTWERAHQRVRAGLEPASPAISQRGRHIRKLLLLPAAAAVFLAFSLMLLPNQGSATSAHLQHVLNQTATYSGWVMMVPRAGADGPQGFSAFNTADGTLAWSAIEAERVRATLLLPALLEAWRYDSREGVVIISTLDGPGAARTAESMMDSLHWLTLIASMREAGQTVHITAAQDGPWQRFELEHTMRRSRGEGGGTDVVWSDPVSGLIQRMRIERQGRQHEFDIVYGVEPVTSIYDLGVPRDAPVRDERGADEPSGLGIQVVATDFPAVLDKEALLAMVRDRHARLQSYQVAYRVHVDPGAENMLVRGRYEITVDGERHRLDQQYTMERDVEGYQHHRIVAFDGEFYTRRFVTLENAHARSRNGGGDADLQASLFHAINLIAPERGKGDQSLITLLLDRHAVLRPHLELVNGRLCHVLDAPRMTVWIDAQRAGVPLRSIIRHSHDARRILAEFVADKLEAVDGVWFITRGRRFSGAIDDERFRMASSVTHLEVERRSDSAPEIQLNPAIGPEMFDLFHDMPPDVPEWRIHDETR